MPLRTRRLRACDFRHVCLRKCPQHTTLRDISTTPSLIEEDRAVSPPAFAAGPATSTVSLVSSCLPAAQDLIVQVPIQAVAGPRYHMKTGNLLKGRFPVFHSRSFGDGGFLASELPATSRPCVFGVEDV